MSKRITIDGYRTLAAKHDFVFLGEVAPETIRTNAEWQCVKGHVFSRTYYQIQTDYGCPYCSQNHTGYAYDYAELGKRMGFIWIGPMPAKNLDKTGWQCTKGHTFYSRKWHIERGIGCPDCRSAKTSEVHRFTIAAYYELARIHGFEFIGPETVTTRAKTYWKCEKGHLFEKSYSHIAHHGQGCPFCNEYVNGAPTSTPQRQLWKMLGGELNHPVGRYRIDVALNVQGINIACEYDCHYWHRVHSDKTKHELRRDKYLISQGWRVLRVKADVLLPTREQLNAAIQLLLDGATYAEIILPDWKDG